jgi:RHS repeat-associated protein
MPGVRSVVSAHPTGRLPSLPHTGRRCHTVVPELLPSATWAITLVAHDAQYTTPDTGLIYLRARTYDPTTAQFLTRDPLAAITGEPYSYAADDPLDLADPTGLSFWAELSVAAGIGAGVAAVIPGADVTVAPFLGGVAVGAGAIAAGEAVSQGHLGDADADAAGASLGVAGVAASAVGASLRPVLEGASIAVPFLGDEGENGGRASNLPLAGCSPSWAAISVWLQTSNRDGDSEHNELECDRHRRRGCLADRRGDLRPEQTPWSR